MSQTKLITLSVEQAEEVAESIEWIATEDIKDFDEEELEMHKHIISAFYSIQNQLKEVAK